MELFPNECTETYYLPPLPKSKSKSDKSEVARGKLVDKFRNIRSFIRSAYNLGQQRELSCDPVGFEGPLHIHETLWFDLWYFISVPALFSITLFSHNVDEEAANSRNWLLHNREAEGVQRHWDLSYPLRKLDSENNAYREVAALLVKWPILAESNGYELVR